MKHWWDKGPEKGTCVQSYTENPGPHFEVHWEYRRQRWWTRLFARIMRILS